MKFFQAITHNKIYFVFRVRECVSISSGPFSSNQYASLEIYYAYSSLHLIISIAINPSHKHIKHKIYGSFLPKTHVPNISLPVTHFSVSATNAHVSLFVCNVSVIFVSLKIRFFWSTLHKRIQY